MKEIDNHDFPNYCLPYVVQQRHWVDFCNKKHFSKE